MAHVRVLQHVIVPSQAVCKCAKFVNVKKKRMFLKVVEACSNHRCAYDRSHRRVAGLGEGETPKALLAVHQLIVKQTAAAELRDRGESDDWKTKKKEVLMLCRPLSPG